MPGKEEADSQIMELWDEIFDLEDKLKEELDIKCAEWRKVEPLIDQEGVDAVEIHMDSMKGVNEASLLIYKEVKSIKNRYREEIDQRQTKIDELKKGKNR